MPSLSHVCSRCEHALEQSRLLDWSEIHQSSEELQQAVHEGCLFCTTTWHHAKLTKRPQALQVFGCRGTSLRAVKSSDEDAVFNRIRIVCSELNPGINGRTICNIAMLPIIEKQLQKNYANPDMASITSASSSLQLAYQWFLACRGLHTKCKIFRKAPKWSPTRLIDVGMIGEKEWKLHIPSEASTTFYNYMTLSYRWSDVPSIQLQTSNYVSFLSGNPIIELPLTFQDAITVCRCFSIRYLWIDCLCIQQDSILDWEVESATMCDVYANSTCNISAIASASPNGGLFRSRNPSSLNPRIVQTSAFGSKVDTFHAIDEGFWERNVTRTTLQQRGWVYQERLLAPRTLHFTESQIFFECFESKKCEQYPLGIPLSNPRRNLFDLFQRRIDYPKPGQDLHVSEDASLEINNTWLALASGYSSCALTYPSDKLVAISGLAHAFRERTRDGYLAGLWKSSMPQSLCWQTDVPARQEPEVYRAPSWSWASTDASVRWVHNMRKESGGKNELCSVIDAQTFVGSEDPTGIVTGGFIVVEGITLKGRVKRYHRDGSTDSNRMSIFFPGCNSGISNHDAEYSHSNEYGWYMTRDCLKTGWVKEEEHEGVDVVCLPVMLNEKPKYLRPGSSGYSIRGLVLRAVMTKEENEGNGEKCAGDEGELEQLDHLDYVRIGLFFVFDGEELNDAGLDFDVESKSIKTLDGGVPKRERIRII